MHDKTTPNPSGKPQRAEDTTKRKRIRVLSPEQLKPKRTQDELSVLDAAAFLIHTAGSMARGKLQDLLYFAQAWHLVWDNEVLYSDPIIAIDDGVNIETIVKRIGKDFMVTTKHFRSSRADKLTSTQKRTLVGVTNFYGKRNHYRLSEEIRDSAPWQEAHKAAGDAIIEPASLFRHYRNA